MRNEIKKRIVGWLMACVIIMSVSGCGASKIEYGPNAKEPDWSKVKAGTDLIVHVTLADWTSIKDITCKASFVSYDGGVQCSLIEPTEYVKGLTRNYEVITVYWVDGRLVYYYEGSKEAQDNTLDWIKSIEAKKDKLK